MHHSLGNLDNFATSHIYGYQKKINPTNYTAQDKHLLILCNPWENIVLWN